jgi:uncharacterized membrane protein
MSYDTLLFLHVASAFVMVTAVGMFVAIALALRSGRHAAAARALTPLAGWLWAVGGLAVIVFGVWLALHVSQYSLTDGWIITAIVLWVIGSALGGRIGAGYRKARGEGAGPVDSTTVLMNVLLVIAVIAILVDMIYKPGAS